MSNKNKYKNRFNASEQANYNIQTGRGWECPTCGSFIRPGEDHCYSCGEMPEIDGMQRGSEYLSDILALLFWFFIMLIIPIIGPLNKLFGYDLSIFLVIPILFILTLSIIELLKIIKELLDGVVYPAYMLTIINRIWVFYFSIKTMIPIVKKLFPLFS